MERPLEEQKKTHSWPSPVWREWHLTAKQFSAKKTLSWFIVGFTGASIAFLLPPLLAGIGNERILQNLYFLEAETGPDKELTRFTYSGNSWAWGARHNEVLGDPNGAGTYDKQIIDMSRVTYVMFTGALIADFVLLGLATWDLTMVRIGYKTLGVLYTYTWAILATAVGLATATFVMARNHFLAKNHEAHLGIPAIALTYTAVLLLLIATILAWIGTIGDNYQTQFWAMMPPPIRDTLGDSIPEMPDDVSRHITPSEIDSLEMQPIQHVQPMELVQPQQLRLPRYQQEVSSYGYPQHEFPNPPDRSRDLARTGRSYSYVRTQAMFHADPASDPHLRRITQRSADEMRAIQRSTDRPGPRWMR
ncbi:SUR7 protein [Colletotrichum sojae]|uniref:SUR7 protein n=1 Tax=Colletotrichum sojae TaxID=2175907 RepID=A0A8H6JNS3_9PEZI|nr:SUR7 protein [Colletotrichum sojae]